jgi:flagellar biosynthesis/type III secretory pathway M-ring protein FliF/YscJ
MMPGIEQAKVSIDETVSLGLQKQTERTALAAVKPIGSRQLAARTAESIREIVSARYAGLTRDGVTVIDLNSGEIFGSSSPQGPWSVPDDPYVIRKRYYEREWRSKIQDMVSMIPSVKVQVNVVLEETGDTNPQQQQPASTLVPIKGIASIAIPRSYYRMIQQRRQDDAALTGSTPVEPIELEAIEEEVGEAVKRMVVGLLPNLSAGTNPYPQVQVSSYLDFSTPSRATPTTLAILSDWLTANWRPVALGTLGLLALLILTVKFRRREQPTEEEIEQPANATTEAAPLDLPSPSLRDELAQLVQEEPDSVVETISRWLKDAA